MILYRQIYDRFIKLPLDYVDLDLQYLEISINNKPQILFTTCIIYYKSFSFLHFQAYENLKKPEYR